MKPLAMRAYILVILAIVAGVQSGPISTDDTCATATCSESVKFGYSVGSTYRFQYEADTVTSLQGASEEHSSLHIRATADVHVLSPCEHVLTLRDVTLEQSDPSDLNRRSLSDNSREFKRALEARPIRFSFHDGHVDSVCADSEDPSWVVNVKRGVISGLQNTMEDLNQNHEGTETDVAGVCTAKYTVAKKGWGGVTTVTKSKDLLACSDRHGHFTSMQATPYKLSSDMQTLPLLRGDHQCDQTIKDGIMQRSEIRESHTFRPFSSQDSGATTTTRQLLNFVSTHQAPAITMGSLRRSNLLFDHSDAEAAATREGEQEVLSVLQEICALADVRPETPRLYSRLVYALRKLDTRALSAMHTRVEREAVCQANNVMAKEFFHDAIPSVSTAASAALMRELIEAGELSETDADIWLTSMAFTAQPSSDMIREISPLLRRPAPSKKMFLTISTLVNSYCRQADDCEYNRDIQQVLEVISANLGYNCRESDNEKVLMTLKALGNTGLHVQAVPILNRCMANAELPMETRVAAIEAYRRMPCGNRDELLKVFTTPEEDSEIRIKAYLAVMQCPTSDVLYQVKQTLATEEVNQVGSFVWTHINNLKETADLFKQEVQDIIGDEFLQKEFNLDARKFSRNYEAAMFFDSLNAGAKVESNLIWSQKSFVPRSANLNLTVDLFGHSVNFLDISGRVEGAEDYLQKMFGPDGYFPAEARQKRSADSDRLLNDLNRADPKMAASLKIFGNELHYWDLSDFTNVDKEDFNILDLLLKLAQEHEVEWSRSAMFLDSEISIPTAIGMPLKLTVNGSATVDVKLGGKFDIRQLAVYPNSMDINGYVKPSGAIEISSVMGLDAFVAQTGLKMVSTLHTSTEVDGLIKLDESRAISAKFNMPKDKIEILNVKTQFFIMHKGEEREQAMLTDNRVTLSKCSCDQTSEALGVRICAEASYPASTKADAPYFPFTGPVSAAIELHKTDDHTAYEFEAYLKAEKQNGAINRFARLAFNTPGSKVDREIFVDMTMDAANNKVSANLQTPWKMATIDGSLVNKAELKSARLEVTMDKKPAFSLVSELQIDARPKATKVTPTVEIRLRNKVLMSVAGDAKYVPGQRIDTDLTMDSTLLSSPIVLRGDIESTGNDNKARWNTDLILKTPFMNTKISGFTQTKDGLLSTRTAFNYNWNDDSKHEFVVNGKMKDQSTKKAAKYMINSAITSTEYPDYNVEMDVDVSSKGMSNLATTVDLHYGADSKDMKKRILFNTELDVNGNFKSLTVDHVGKLKWKAMDIDMQTKLSHSHTLYRDLKTNAKFSYSPNKDISMNVDLQREQGPLTKMSGDIMFEYPGREMRFTKSIEQTSDDQFSHEMLFQWQQKAQVRSSSVYTRYPVERRHEITTELYGPVGKPTVVTGSATLKIDDFSGKVQVAHRGDIYQAETKYDYDLTGPRKSLNANLDVNMPSRHVTADATMSSAKGEHNLSIKSAWDADRDANQKFSLNGVLSTQPKNQAGDIKVSIPSRTVSVSFNNKYDGQNFNSRADVTWAPQQTVSVISTGSFDVSAYSQKVQGSLEVNTPFFSQVSVNVNHRFNKRRLENQLDYSYGGDKIVSSDLSVQMTDGVNAMENRYVLTIPVARVILAESHALTPNSFTGHIEGNVNNQMMSADVTGELAGNTVKASASLQTPFRVIRKAVASWEHAVNDRTITARAEASINRMSVTADMTHMFAGNSLNNKLTIQTSFDAMRKVEAETAYTYSRSRSVNGNFALSRNDVQVIAVNGELNFARDIEGKMALQSQFTNMEDLSTLFYVKSSQSPKEAHAEFKWGANQVMALHGELTNKGYNQNVVELRFTSPFPTAERLVLTHDQTLNNGEWQAVSEFEYAARKTVKLETAFSNSRGPSVSFKLDSPCPYMRTLAASLTHSGRGFSFNNKFSTNFKSDYANLDIDHILTMRGADLIKGNTQVSSSSFGQVQVTVNHQEVEGELISKVDINMPRRKTVTLETRYKSQGAIAASAELTTTFPQVPSFKVQVNHAGQGAYFTNKVVVDSQIMRQPIHFDSDIAIRGMESQEVKLQWTSPFENMEDLAFAVSHSFDGQDLNCHCEVKLDSRRSIVYDNKLSLGSTFKLNTDLKTPFRAFRSLLIDVEQTGSISRFNHKANMKVITAQGESSYDSSVRMAGWRMINGQVTINTPFAQMRQAQMSLNHGLRGAAWMTDFDMTLPTSDKIVFNSNVNLEEMSLDMKLQTPFTEDIALTANRAIKGGEMVAVTSFTYAPYKTIEAQVTYANGAAFKVDAQLTTPFEVIRNLQATVEHTGQLTNFDSKVTLTHNSNTITSTGSFQLSGLNMNANLELTTPIRAARKLSLNIEHSGDLTNFNNKLEFARNNDNYAYAGSFEAARAVKGDFKLTTPHQPVELIQVTFSSNGVRRNNLEITYAKGQTIEVSSVINMNNGFRANAEFKAPFSAPMIVAISCAGLTHSTELSYGNKRVTFNTELSMSPPSAKVTFTSPFQAVRNVEWTVSANGHDIGDFSMETAFEHNSVKAFDFSVEFFNRDEMRGKAQWTSRFENFEDISVEFNHNGNARNFQTTGQLSYAPGKKMAASLQVKTSPSIEVHFNIDTPCPHFQNLNVNFVHTGNMDDFTTTADLSYNGKKQGDMTLTFSQDKFNVQGSIKVNSVFLELDTDFSHKSNRRLVASEGKININGQIVSGQTRIQITPTVDIFIAAQSPFKYLKDVSLKMEGQDDSNTMGGNLVAKSDVFGRMKMEGSVQRQPVEVKFQIQTPSNYMRDASLNLKHNGDLSQFTNELRVSHNKLGEASYTGSFSANPVTGTFEIATPYSQLANLKVNFDHQRQARGFRCNAVVSVNERDYKLAADMKTSPESTITIETPHRVLRKLEVTAKSNNNLNNYDGSLTIMKNGEEFVSTQATWDIAEFPSVSANMKLNTAFDAVKAFEATIRHGQRPAQFTDFLQINHNNMQLIRFESEMKVRPVIAGNFVLEVPTTSLKGEFSHDGSVEQFRTHAEFTHNTHNQFMADVAFAMNPMEASLQISTPFPQLESASVKVNHRGSLLNFQSSAEMTVNNRDKYGAQVQFAPSQGTVSINTPFRGYRNVNGAFNFNGNSEQFNGKASMSADNREFAVDSSFQMRPLTGKLTVKTPISNYEDLAAEFTHKGNFRNGFSSQASATYKAGQTIAASADVNLARRKIDLTATTPFSGYEVMELHGKHSMDNGMSTKLSGALGDDKASAELTLVMAPHFEARLDINTPVRGFKRIAVTGDHKMTRNGINSNAQISYGGKTIETSVIGQFNGVNDMNGAIAITTPFRGFRNMAISGSHQTRPSIKTAFEASLNDQKVEAAFNMENTNTIDATATLNTPFSGYEQISASLNHAGNLRQFNTKFTTAYGQGKEVVVLATFDSTRDIVGLVKLTCPCPYVNNIGAQFNFRGELANFEAEGKLFKDAEEMKVTTTYSSSNGIPTLLNVLIATPFSEDFTIEANNNYRRNGNFQTSASLAWSPYQKIQVQADGNLRGSVSNLALNGNLQISTPFRAFNQMVLTTQHQHNMDSISNKLDIDFNREKVFDAEVAYSKASGKVEMRQPYNLAASVDTTGELNDLSSNVKLQWNRDSNVQFQVTHKDASSGNGLEKDVTVKMITVFRTMSVSTSVLKNTYTFTHNAAFSWDEARDKTVSYKVDFNDASRRYNHRYTLNAGLYTPIRSAELTMNHNDDSATYNTEATLKWDAKRDESKQLTMSNKYTLSGNSHEDELTIRHPAMAKDLTLRNKFALNNGKVIFNGRTEIDFLSSPVMLDVLVEDKATEYGAKNYSLTIGCSHPSSTVDIQTVAHIANSRSMMTSGLSLQYLTARRQQVNMGLQAQIDKIKKAMSVQIDTPLKSAVLSGDLTPVRRGYALNVAAESEGKSLNGRIETSAEEFDMKVFYSPENEANVLHVSGKYLSPTDMSMEAYRMHNGQRITESTLNIDLENGHLLKSKIYWRPSMVGDIKSKAQIVSRQVAREVRQMAQEAGQAFHVETMYKTQLISSNAPDMSPLMRSLSEEAASFQRDFQVISRAASQMYARNEFFSRSIAEATSQAVQTVKRSAAQAVTAAAQATAQARVVLAQQWEQFVFQARLQSFKLAAALNRYVESAMESAYYGMNVAQVKLQEYLVILGEKAGQCINDMAVRFQAYREAVVARTLAVAERVLVAVKPVMEVAMELYENALALYAKASEYAADKFEVVKRKLPLTYMSKKWSQLTAAVTGIDLLTPVSNVQVSVRDTVKQGVSSLNDVVTKMARKSNKQLSQRMAILNARFVDFLEHDDTKYAHQLVQEAYNQAKSAFEYLEVEKKVTELIKDSAEAIVRVVRKNAFYMIDDYLNLDQDKILEYNPREGTIDFQLWIPMRLPSFQGVKLPDVTVAREVYAQAKEIAYGLVPEDFSPMDYYYQYKPKTDSMLPPFEAYAMISGTQHYMTFDKKFFEFAGSCSYTLAREFVSQTFEVLVNYDNDREVSRKSITVRTEGKEVEIASNGVVSVDGAQTELPVEFGAVQITRDGHMILLRSAKGFGVSCDVANDMCMLNISGWYFNKVAGLFGTYTNEPSDDLLTSTARQASDMREFTHSWVSGSCRSIENRARAWDSESKHACQKLFNNNDSAFRRCYKVVNPAPFLEMCGNDVLEDVSNMGDESSACKAAAMYVKACKQEGVPLRMPRVCVKCDKPSYDTYTEGEELTAYAADHSADVIFVVEEKPCNVDAIAKLGDIAVEIDNAFKAKELKNNQFGLIGFGGDGIHDDDHIHTVASKILGSSSDFASAVSKLDATKVGTNTDVFKALRQAAKYPFRAGVAKSVVLVTCSECTEQAARYNEIAYNLRTRGISLHVIMNHEFRLGPHDLETPKTSQLIGIDKDTAFLSRHVADKDLAGDKDLFALITVPETKCARLAQETDGSFFDMDKLVASRVRFQKHFVDVFSRRVAKSAVVPDCQVCECEADANGAARSVCKPCTGAAVPAMQPIDFAGLPPAPEEFYLNKPQPFDFEEA